jgi:hypothetical protein
MKKLSLFSSLLILVLLFTASAAYSGGRHSGYSRSHGRHSGYSRSYGHGGYSRSHRAYARPYYRSRPYYGRRYHAWSYPRYRRHYYGRSTGLAGFLWSYPAYADSYGAPSPAFTPGAQPELETPVIQPTVANIVSDGDRQLRAVETDFRAGRITLDEFRARKRALTAEQKEGSQ